jgi:hypothetical protein
MLPPELASLAKKLRVRTGRTRSSLIEDAARWAADMMDADPEWMRRNERRPEDYVWDGDPDRQTWTPTSSAVSHPTALIIQEISDRSLIPMRFVPAFLIRKYHGPTFASLAAPDPARVYRKQCGLYLDSNLVAELHAHAARLGVSKSSLYESLLRDGLARLDAERFVTLSQ